ncbi:MAG TPA: glycosyltransferase family 39 protein [Solirubrobacteraceae bacterium]|nr:glycosyltransferase family 39 protein [Solirubrobacteraceae bacterium]
MSALFIEVLPRSRARRGLRADVVTLAVPALLGAVLCAIQLNTRSLWIDEGATVSIASQHGAALWHGIAHDGGNMLLYYLLTHVVISLFGGAAWVVRAPSVLATAATGALTAALGLELLDDRRLAAGAGVLTVSSLPLIFWGQDARGYALMVALATASMLAFALLLERPSPAVVLAYVLTTLAMLYVGYDAALLILAQLAMLPFLRDRARAVIACLAAVALLCVPLMVLAVQRGSGQLFWVPPLSGQVLGQSALTLLSAGLPPNFHHTATTIVAAVLFGALALAAVLLPLRSGRWPAGPRPEWRWWLLASWFAVPLLVALLVSVAGKPIELARCAILLMPALSLLVVWWLADSRMGPVAGTGVFVAVVVLRLLQVVPAYGVSPEDWKAASAYVAAGSRAAPACVAFYPQDGRELFDYYLRGTAAARTLTPVLPALGWGTVAPYVETYETLDAAQRQAVAGRCSRLYLVASHVGQSSGPATSRANLRRYEQLQSALAGLYGGPATARQFGWAAPVTVTLYTR